MSPAERQAPTRSQRHMLWAMVLTATFTLAEIAGGLLSGSLALLADAGHMLTDTAALAIAWGAGRLSQRPPDQLRSYGYQRLQVLAALLNGIGFIAIVIWIIIEAYRRLQQPVEVLGGPMLAVAVVGLLVNLIVLKLLHGGHSHDLNVRAAMLHVLGDLLGSVAAISAAGIILLTGWTPIDPLLSVLVALLILNSAIRVVRQALHILLEGTPEDFDRLALEQALVESVPSIAGIHHVHVWSLSPEHPLLTMHVDVNDLGDYNRTLQEIRRVLSEDFSIHHATVQIEPGPCIDSHSSGGR
ncbi:MAG: cation diffusion facilitator family transporter [Gammaproteobacteria bacterium]|jgi:cobalt-zinc-cadmium efflux system protein